MKFIQINNRILDYEEYREEIIRLRNNLLFDLREYFSRFGINLMKNSEKCYSTASAKFYSEDLDLEVNVKFRKKGKERFV